MEGEMNAAAPPQRHVLSSGATPFIPTFMRAAEPPAQPCGSGNVAPSQEPNSPPTAAGRGSGRGEGGGRRGRGSRGSRNQQRRQLQQQQQQEAIMQTTRAATSMLTQAAFESLLTGMEDDDVDMLMQSMPPEVGQLYATHLTHYTRAKAGGRVNQQSMRTGERQGQRSGGGGSSRATDQRTPALSAALATFGDLSQDQLSLLEDFLWQMGEEDEITAYRATVEGGGHEMYDGMEGFDPNVGIFQNADDGLNADEEAWFLEQMMAADAAAQRENNQTQKQQQQQKGPQ